MTAPFAQVLPARLSVVAVWDAPLVRRAVAVLEETAERLSPWRGRLETVGRALESGDSWAGPAAQQASAAVRELSTVTWSVDMALARSLAAFGRLATEAETAQALAAEALVLTGPVPHPDLWSGLPGAADLAPALATGEMAIRHAAAARAAADDAGAAMTDLGVRDAFAPADFLDLAARTRLVGPFVPPQPPRERRPAAVAAWWAALPAGSRLAAIHAAPALVGALDGVPAWARDQANRAMLARALADPTSPAREVETAAAVARQIAAEETGGRQVQLHLLDLAGDRVVLALGDLDTADAVAVLVPGFGTTPADDLGRHTGTARDLAVAARAAEPGLAVATVAYLGYRAPATLAGAVTRAAAAHGAAGLVATLEGLQEARAATGTAPGRTTVLAHSYGTVLVDEAADEPGVLAADAVVLLGSPGMEEDARSLEAPEVYDAAADADLVAGLGWFGLGTRAERYGSVGLPVAGSMGHSDYYEPELPTLAAMGEVVGGPRTPD